MTDYKNAYEANFFFTKSKHIPAHSALLTEMYQTADRSGVHLIKRRWGGAKLQNCIN